MPDIDDPIAIYRGSKVAAGFLKGLLEDAGIEVFLWGEDNPSPWPRWNPLLPEKGYGIDVVIAKRDLEKARPILQRFLDEKLFEQNQ